MSNTPQSDPSESPPAAVATSERLSGRSATLNDIFDVYFDHPVARLAQPGVRVYQARSIRGGAGCLAYVCERMVIPRLQVAEKIVAIQNPSLMRLLSRGVIRCPDGFQRYTIIYENTVGQPLVPHKGEAAVYSMRPDMVMNAIIKPIALLLQDMHNADLVHGGIRPDNLFDGGNTPMQRAVLGDGIAQSFSAAQPMLYLPPYLAFAVPAGRGLGTRADDMYAFGATLAILMRTHDPMQGKSEQDVLLSKLELGSFSTLLGNERIPSNIMELLRGLLQDDINLRWSIDDVMGWFEGRRAAHRQGLKKLKASRHIDFAEHKILLPAVFAYYGTQSPSDVVKLIDNMEIKQWLTRSISDNKLDDRYEMAIETSKEYGRGVGFQDRVASRIAIAFEPDFPIVFRGVRLYPDSFGTVLAELMIQGQDPKPIADLINDQAVMFWMNMQHDVPSDVNLVLGRFEQCQQFLKQRTIGYGLERCLYFLSPDVPCLSQKLRGFYVNTPEDLFKALNEIADMNDRPETIFDRHIIAFLSVRDRKVIDNYLPDLNASDSYRQIAGTVNTLAAIQARSKMPPMPALTKWLVSLCEPVYSRFHDRDLRAQLKKKASDIRETGSVQKIVDLLFDAERYRRDQFEFRLAMRDYYNISIEDRNLSEAMKRQDIFGVQSGREIAALIAGVVMAIAVAGITVLKLNQGAMPW